MLVLTRKVRDEVIIGETIRVVVLKAGNGRVKLGFTAPEDVTIRREELCPKSPGPQVQRPDAACNRVA
jgi:carbon storage regulator